MTSVYKKNADTGNRKAAWYFSYVDEKGKWRQKKGFTDKTETEKFANKLEDEARMVREGLKQAIIHPEQRTVELQLVNYLKHLRQRDVSNIQLVNLEGRIRKITDACRFISIDDIQSQPVEDYLSKRRKEGMGKQTSNHYRQAIFQFCRWLIRGSVLTKNPVADIPKLNVQTDRRHDRRALSDKEFSRLVEAAVAGPRVESIEGIDRAMMYILSAWTGYRRGEIGSLTLSSFDLESNPPTVTVDATHSKRRKRDVQVLHPEVVVRMQSWLSERKPQHKSFLFPISKEACGFERKTAKMMRSDLEYARTRWISEAESEEEIKTRTQSDFLSYKNQSGLFADFHANRHTFITNLAKGGVSPKVAQMLARHSDIRLTMNVYTHTDLAEKVCAISKLPSLEGYSISPSVSDVLVGPKSDTQQRYSSSCETEIDIQRQSLSSVGGNRNFPASKRRRRKPLLDKGLADGDEECHRITEVHLSGFEPETFGSVDRCSIQLSYRCSKHCSTF